MKTSLIILFIFGSTFEGLTQSFDWKWVQGANSTNSSVGLAITYSPDSAFVYVGGRNTNNALASLGIINASSSGTDGFVAKYTNTGTLVWEFNIGSNSFDEVTAIDVNNLGEVLVGGSFQSICTFQGVTGPSVFRISAGNSDAFVAKYNSNGILQWVTVGAGAGNDYVRDVKFAGNAIYVAGESGSTFTMGSSVLPNMGGLDGYAVQMGLDGAVNWLTGIGSNQDDGYNSVTILGNSAYFGGYYSGSSLSFNATTVVTTGNSQAGNREGVLTRYNNASGVYISHAFISGSGDQAVTDMTNDGTSIYYTGYFERATTFPGVVTPNLTKEEFFVVRCDQNFNTTWLNYSSTNSSNESRGSSIDIDVNGNLFVSSIYSGTTTFLGNTFTSVSNIDFLLSLINASTGANVFTSSVGGTGQDVANSVAIKNRNELYVIGSYQNTVNFTPLSRTGTSNDNAFFGRYGCAQGTAIISGNSTICIGNSATLNLAFTGGAPYSVTISDGSSDTTISGILSSSLSYAVAPGSTRSYTITSFISNGCASSFSGSSTVTVVAPVTNNDILGSNQVCLATGALNLIGNVPSGGVGTYLYNWEFSQNGAAFANIGPPVTTKDYLANALTMVTQYRRRVNTAACPNFVYSDTITIDAPMSGNTISTSDQTLCISTSLTILATIPTNGATAYTYLWEKSNDGIIWMAADLTNNGQNYTVPNTLGTVFYRRQARSGQCGFSPSNNVIINYQVPITNNVIFAKSDVVCSSIAADSILGSVISGGNGTPSYLWQQRSLASPVWITATGPNSTSLHYVPGTLAQSTIFRRRVVAGVCDTSFSNVDTVLVQTVISSNTITIANQAFCETAVPDTIFGSTVGGGNGLPTYLWEQRTLTNPTWIAATGTSNTGKNYAPGAVNSTFLFRRRVTAGVCPTSISNVDTLTIHSVLSSNNIVTPNQHICQTVLPDTIMANIPTGGVAPYTYLWENSTTQNPTWTSLSANTSFLSPGLLTQTSFFRRTVSGGVCPSLVSTVHIIQVDSTIANNTIFSPALVCFSPTLVLNGSDPTGGNGTDNFIWEFSADGLNFNLITPNIQTEDLLVNSSSASLFYRRRVVSGLCPESFSNIINVDIPVSNNTILSRDQFICSTTIPDTILASSASGTNSGYQWQIGNSAGVWTNAAGSTANSIDYFSGLIIDTTYFRRIVLGNVCGNDTSAVSAIHVNNPILSNTISGDTTICFGAQPSPIVSSISINGFNTQWEQTTDTTIVTLWSVIPGATSASFAPSALTTTTFFRKLITGGFCPDSYSNITTISVNPPIQNNTILGDIVVCVDADSLVLTGTGLIGGSGNNTFVWESSIAGGSFSVAQGTSNQNNYTTGSILQPMVFRRRAINNVCPSQDSLSNEVLVDVFAPSSASFVVQKDSVCQGAELSIEALVSGNQPFTLYMMYGAQNATQSGVTAASFSFTFLANNTNSLILDSISDGNGCTFDLTDSMVIRVIAQPETVFLLDTNLCDTSYLFNPNLSIGLVSVTSPTLGSITNSLPFTYVPAEYGIHSFVLTEINEICIDSDTMQLGIWKPIGEISAGVDQLINDFYETNLDATDLVGTETGSWSILDGEGIISSPNAPNTVVYDLTSGPHFFIWTVSNGVCPARQDTVKITVQDFFIPTGISPNGDGDNDFFALKGITKFENIGLQIFNRWGNSVYANKNYQNDWDGKLPSGEDLPEDTYYYILDLSEKEMHKGFIVLKR